MDNDQMLTHIPFDFTGQIFRCPMPYGRSDENGFGLTEMKDNRVKAVVVLVEGDEIRMKTGKDLLALYRENGMQVIHLPIKDFGIPDQDELNDAINQVIELAKNGTNIAVHCSAGRGRTGLFMAVLAKKVNGWDGNTAVNWIRELVYGAVETDEQTEFVLRS